MAPVAVDPLAEPRQLGAVDEGPPAALGRALSDVELDRVGAAVEHGVALGRARQDAGETRGIGGIEEVGEAKRTNLIRDGRRVFALDGERPGAQLPSATTSVISAEQPFGAYRTRRLCTDTARIPRDGPVSSRRNSSSV